MRILVLGAGSVGGCFGGRLAECGADVTFLVRPRRRAQLTQNGLVVRSGFGDIELPVATVSSEEISAPFDLVLVSCKAYDLDDAMAAIAPAVGPDTAILPLLNGLQHLDRLQARFGTANVWGGACYIGADYNAESGEIRHFGEFHRIAFGELAGGPSARGDAFAALNAVAMIDIARSADIEQTMWDKFAMLVALSSANILARGTVGDILEAPSGEAFLLTTLAECRDAAAALGHPVSEATLAMYTRMFTTRGSPFATSMFRDVEAGRRSEGEAIIGDLVGRTAAAGIDVPTVRCALAAVEVNEARVRKTAAEHATQ